MDKGNQDRIDAYVRGEMSHKEVVKFESDLKADITLHNDFIETKAIIKALADRKEKLDMMACWDAEEELYLKTLHRRQKIRRWTIGMSAAACVVIGFFAVRPLFFSSSNYWTSDFGVSNFGNEESCNGDDNLMKKLDSLITVKDYENALTFAEILILKYKNEVRQYEAKDSLTEKEVRNKNECEKALADLEWKRLNLLVALGRISEAKNILKYIIDGDGEYRSQADSLLNTIDHK